LLTFFETLFALAGAGHDPEAMTPTVQRLVHAALGLDAP
jgi:hypothetical protein